MMRREPGAGPRGEKRMGDKFKKAPRRKSEPVKRVPLSEDAKAQYEQLAREREQQQRRYDAHLPADKPSRYPAASRGASGDKAAPGEYLVRRDAVTPSHQADGQTWLVRLLDNPDHLGRAPAAPTLNRPAVAYLVGNRMLR